MQQLMRILMLGIALQAGFFALEADILQEKDVVMANQDKGRTIKRVGSRGHCKDRHRRHDRHGPVGSNGPTGPQGLPGQPFGNYASFFLTTGSGSVDVTPGENVLFNNQVALLGIQYDSTTGVFTLRPGTYAVTYFFDPRNIPSVNMYVNGQLILNSPLGGSSTVLTLTEPTNTLVLQYIFEQSFSAPEANQSWASIAIFQID